MIIEGNRLQPKLRCTSVPVNSAGLDETPFYVIFHLHCLPKYPFIGFQHTKF